MGLKVHQDSSKLMKPVLANLRNKGFTLSAYIDDIFCLDESYNNCKRAMDETKVMLHSVGFTVHPDKSMDEPKQIVTVLGFEIDSRAMTVRVTADKKQKIICTCLDLLECKTAPIRLVAHVIGKLVACFPGVEMGSRHYRELESQKTIALAQNCGNYDAKMYITNSMKMELQWWIENLPLAHNNISRENPHLTLETDASLLGWGCCLPPFRTGGRFSSEELKTWGTNINALELLAIKLALKAFESRLAGKHILIKSDNTSAVAGIRNMGSSRSTCCNTLAKQIWHWAVTHNAWLSCTHLAGVLNGTADFESRNFNERTEWSLNTKISKRSLWFWDGQR